MTSPREGVREEGRPLRALRRSHAGHTYACQAGEWSAISTQRMRPPQSSQSRQLGQSAYRTVTSTGFATKIVRDMRSPERRRTNHSFEERRGHPLWGPFLRIVEGHALAQARAAPVIPKEAMPAGT